MESAMLFWINFVDACSLNRSIASKCIFNLINFNSSMVYAEAKEVRSLLITRPLNIVNIDIDFHL